MDRTDGDASFAFGYRRWGAIIAITFTCLTFAAGSTQMKKDLSPQEEIPKNFKTWSLFLVCNPKWLESTTPDTSNNLEKLYQSFETFGRTIGDDNAAVWFSLTGGQRNADLTPTHRIDVERSVRFCAAWKLAPSSSPYVVVTSSYPDETKLSTGLSKNSAQFTSLAIWVLKTSPICWLN